MKKLILVSILILALFLGLKYGNKTTAFYGAGEYINIYGNWVVPMSCKAQEACNQYHYQGNNCIPDEGSCSTSNNWWVYKYICDGKPSDSKCGGGVAQAELLSKVQNGQLKVDGNNVSCGKTVQLDVFDEECDPNGEPWKCDVDHDGDGNLSDDEKDNKDFMVWYSGDCPEPTATPTVTPPVVACGTNCTDNADICLQATDSCTVCNADKVCAPPPTTGGTGPTTGTGTGPTTTGTTTGGGPACDVSCDNQPADFCQQASGGCTVCDLTSKRCVPPNTQPPTTGGTGPTTGTGPGTTTGATTIPPSPTPDFNTAACKCDGIESTTIFPGQPVEVTAFGKVEGADTSKAMVSSMQFLLYEGQSGSANTAAVLESETVPASKVSVTGKDRYTAKWNTTIPANIKVGANYRIQAKLKCEKKTTAYATGESAVLGEGTSIGFFDRFINFFRNLFSRNVTEKATVFPTPTVVQDSSEEFQGIAGDTKQLQLKKIVPAQTETDKCSIIRFQFTQ